MAITPHVRRIDRRKNSRKLEFILCCECNREAWVFGRQVFAVTEFENFGTRISIGVRQLYIILSQGIGIDRVAQAVADKVYGEDGHNDEESRNQQPRLLQEDTYQLRLLQEGAPARLGRLDA